MPRWSQGAERLLQTTDKLSKTGERITQGKCRQQLLERGTARLEIRLVHQICAKPFYLVCMCTVSPKSTANGISGRQFLVNDAPGVSCGSVSRQALLR